MAEIERGVALRDSGEACGYTSMLRSKNKAAAELNVIADSISEKDIPRCSGKELRGPA